MTKYADDCAILIHGEMEDAIKNYGLFASPHDGLGVIWEELEEAQEAMGAAEEAFLDFKTCIRADDVEAAVHSSVQLYQKAWNAMIENMQLAATAKKFATTFGGQTDGADPV